MTEVGLFGLNGVNAPVQDIPHHYAGVRQDIEAEHARTLPHSMVGKHAMVLLTKKSTVLPPVQTEVRFSKKIDFSVITFFKTILDIHPLLSYLRILMMHLK